MGQILHSNMSRIFFYVRSGWAFGPAGRGGACRKIRPGKPPFRDPPFAGIRSSPVFDCSNIAKYDRTHSRRRMPDYSGPDSAFFRIMTAGIRGLGEKRYNRVRYVPRCTRIPAGVFRMRQVTRPRAGEESAGLFD